MAIIKTPPYCFITAISLKYLMVTKFSNVVQMGMLNKSVAFDTISLVGGATRFQNITAGVAANSLQLSHTIS